MNECVLERSESESKVSDYMVYRSHIHGCVWYGQIRKFVFFRPIHE